MDLMAPARLAAIFHADDPVLSASSAGALQQSVDAMASWAKRHNALLHIAPRKSVYMCSGALAKGDAPLPLTPLRIPEGAGGPGELHWAESQRYLGLQWPCDLDFAPVLFERLAIAESSVGELVALVAAGAVPITITV